MVNPTLVMSRDVGDYLAEIGPPAIKIVFPRNERDRTRFSKFHCKRLQPYGEGVGHLWLLFLAWKNMFYYYFKLFSFGYPRAQHSIPLLCRYYTSASLLITEVSGRRGGINVGCNSLIYWV